MSSLRIYIELTLTVKLIILAALSMKGDRLIDFLPKNLRIIIFLIGDIIAKNKRNLIVPCLLETLRDFQSYS